MDRLRAGRRQLPTAAGGNAVARASELRLPIPLLLLALPLTGWSPARLLCFSRAPAPSTRDFFSLVLALFRFSPADSPAYGARHARFGANRTPKRRFLDDTVVRRTPYESKASRLLWHPAWSALALKRRQSDDKATP